MLRYLATIPIRLRQTAWASVIHAFAPSLVADLRGALRLIWRRSR